MKILTLPEIPDGAYKALGYPYETKCSDMVILTTEEADAYYEAAYDCFQMVDKATEKVIESDDLLKKFSVPEYMYSLIRSTYEKYESNPHMVGRFDFAGGLDGLPIKLIEFNGDTPFSIFETAIVQDILARHNGYDPYTTQYNTLWEKLSEFFDYLNNNHLVGDTVFTNSKDPEDDLTTLILMETAQEHIKTCHYKHWSELCMDANFGLVTTIKDNYGEERIDKTFKTMVKMYPWDLMFKYDKDFTKDIAKAMMDKGLVSCNPPYAYIYQNKLLMGYMKDMYPDSPYLLKQSMNLADILADPSSDYYVRKPVLGREGANVSVTNRIIGRDVDSTEGDYSDGEFIYQEHAKLNHHKYNLYQAGVFVSMEDPCGISFRRSKGPIITADSEICGHLILND